MARKLVAAALLALAAVFAIPAAANAAGYATYTGEGPGVVNAQRGLSVAMQFTDLPPQVPSTASADDNVTLSVLKATTASKPTDAAGTVTYEAMAEEVGTYTVTVTAGGEVATATLVVLPEDSAAGGSTGGLPSTGYDFPVLLLWGGAGAVVLGVALVGVLATVRRNRASA
jgi:hypothetical protein